MLEENTHWMGYEVTRYTSVEPPPLLATLGTVNVNLFMKFYEV
jgi:hypothetical protein